MTIADKLLLLNATKTAIATAIEDKGVTVGGIPFSQYPSKIAEISGGGEVPADGWVRPVDWLPLPEVLPTEQKFVGLYAVDDDDSNFIALLAEGGYTVDWGDGVVENFASNVMAEHQYNYASLPAESLSNRGYRQVVVTLTPQAGQNLTLLNIDQRPAGFGDQRRGLQWLDVAISAPNATFLAVYSFSENATLDALEQCAVVSSSVTDMSYMFYGCYNLRSVPLLDTSSVTYMYGMFESCNNLQSVPLLDTSSVTAMSGMFSGCTNLQSVPLLDTSSVTDMSYMFSGCNNLQSVPLLDTSSVTAMHGMFESCNNLQSVPLLDTSSVAAMSYMFNRCYNLQSVPLLDTSSVTAMSGMFNRCNSLRSVPLLDTSSVADMSYMFESCYSLRSVPLLDTSSATDMSAMFGSCTSMGRSQVTGTEVEHSYWDCNLSATALNEVFTNLATVTGQTITITNNPGTATCDRAIATAKGWTVMV